MDLESDPCCCAGRYWLPRGTGLAEVTDWAWPGGRTPLAGLHQHHVRPGEPDHDRRAGIDVVADSTRATMAGRACAGGDFSQATSGIHGAAGPPSGRLLARSRELVGRHLAAGGGRL